MRGMTTTAKDTGRVVFGVFPTAWGPMGGVMGPSGLRRLILPHYSPSDLHDLLAWETPDAAHDDAAFEPLAALCRDYMNRKPVDFNGVACDLCACGPFGRRILEACRTIPYGQTRSYTQLAVMAGETGKQRAVAQAMGRNPVPLIVPCHRVVGAGRSLGGFSAPGGVDLKRRMLELERDATGGS